MFARLTLAASALFLAAAPASAQVIKLDLSQAKLNYEAGKSSGETPQTRREYLRCMVMWRQMEKLEESRLLGEEHYAVLGPDFTSGKPLSNREAFAKLGQSEESVGVKILQEELTKHSDLLKQAVLGNEGDNKFLFETLGTCQV